MALIRKIIKTSSNEHYPFSVPVIENLKELDLEQDIIIFSGENGSGKSTLLEIIALKLNLVRISLDINYSDPEFSDLKAAINAFTVEFSLKPNGFFFRSEDFISYLRYLNKTKVEAEKELKRIETEYREKSAYSKILASMPHKRTLNELDNLYQRNLEEQSHGESYLDFFKSRLRPKNLYLLDEAEVPLSFQNQLTLMVLIKNAVAEGCQFIISTHSPVLMAFPGACIYDFNQEVIKEINYEDIEAVNQLRNFLNDRDRYFKYLFD
ncbi:MAG TPA: AAA family ATPase [Acholeplasmataceae bacterium]|jgi:predicted ATPase|nr:AAA family ATPase [Acholeplasmataceae bacterium]